jgi:hypothetical protein
MSTCPSKNVLSELFFQDVGFPEMMGHLDDRCTQKNNNTHLKKVCFLLVGGDKKEEM